MSKANEKISMRIQLIIFMFLRTILNTAHRMVYPFLSVFARGLGVSLETMSAVMTVRALLGATSPIFAPIADRRGRKFGMLAGLAVFTIGLAFVALGDLFQDCWRFFGSVGIEHDHHATRITRQDRDDDFRSDAQSLADELIFGEAVGRS